MEKSGGIETSGPESNRALPLLVVLFIGSGCSALIYEIVWFQLLELVIGASTISIGVLLGTFMGGMCLGSLMLPRFISRAHHPLRVYGLLELGIGAIGLLVLFGMPVVASVYTAWAGPGFAGLAFRAIVAGACLLPPTLLMGATLPAISRWVEATPRGVSWLGFFYGGNIAGAVVGSLLAGFYLLRVHDMSIATFTAVAINVTIGLVSLGLARTTPYSPAVESEQEVKPEADAWAVYVAIGLSGMTALAAEVLWTRLLSLLIGATVYAFALILAVFLAGLGIGSSIGSTIARDTGRARAAFGACQLFLCAAMAWTAYMLSESLPFWPINPSLSTDPWLNLQMDLVRCIWAVLLPAILWGASFPLALAAVAAEGQDPARLVGGVYAANTAGAIVGSLSASLILVAWIGTQQAQQLLIVISAISGALLFAPTAITRKSGRVRLEIPGLAALILTIGFSGWFALGVPEVPKRLVAYGRFLMARGAENEIFYVGEGLTASVAVSQTPSGTLNYHNAGKVQASSDPVDMRLQRMLGHLTTLIPENPQSVLVIGCGAGVTAGAASIDPRVERLTIAEIEPLVPEVVSTYFGEQNFDVVRNPKVHVQIDDGRHFLQTTDQKFDGITSDPLDPWVKGAAALYTVEFWKLVKRRLNPGGVVTVFVQLYESNEEAVKSEIGTFFQVFPHGTIWANTAAGEGYDLVMMGQAQASRVDLNTIQSRLNSPEYTRVAMSLSELGFASAVSLFATYGGRASDLQPWLADAAINRDRNMRLQYLAGMGLNLYQANLIYSNMLQYSRFPEDLFVGTPASIQALRAAIQLPAGP